MKYTILFFICLTTFLSSETTVHFDEKTWKLFCYKEQEGQIKQKYYPVKDNLPDHKEEIVFTLTINSPEEPKECLQAHNDCLEKIHNWYSLQPEAHFQMETNILLELCEELIWETKLTDTEFGLPWYFLTRYYREANRVYCICYRTYGCCIHPETLRNKWVPILTEYTTLLPHIKGETNEKNPICAMCPSLPHLPDPCQ